jgi:hypothetical protein
VAPEEILERAIQISVEGVVHELRQDAIGLWQIAPKGRVEFGLDGDELAEFVRRHLVAMFRHGAWPVRTKVEAGRKIWAVDTSYGTEPEEMAQGIVATCLGRAAEADVEGLWFNIQ